MKCFRLIFIIPIWASILAVSIGICLFYPVEARGLEDVFSWFQLPGIDLSLLRGPVVDTSNDEAAYLDTHQLIERAGFQYENYYALGDDGYMTQLIRIINPLADAAFLKRPPIIVQHGQTANSKNFVMQSNKQHHPMPYPKPRDRNRGFFHFGDYFSSRRQQPSSNRSIAFMLANNGYDVWLSSTRGVDSNNMGFVPPTIQQRVVSSSRMTQKNMSLGEEILLRERIKKSYWSFTLDDQIAHDLPAQIATVMNITGAPQISLFGYSNTALTTFAMLSIRPDIAAFVDTYIAAAPVVYYNKPDGWFKWFMGEFMRLMPRDIDTSLFLSDSVADFIRSCTMKLCSNVMVRYTLCKFSLDALFGTSSQFRTLLEMPFFAHLVRQTSWKCLAQHVQIVKNHKLAKFDYGPKLNLKYYNSIEPPEYDLGMVDDRVNIVLVSGEQDSWANQATLDEIRNRLPRPPALDLVLQDYNHLDLAAAYDVDIKVNLPILRFLDQRHFELTVEAHKRQQIMIPVPEAHFMRTLPPIPVEPVAAPPTPASEIDQAEKGEGGEGGEKEEEEEEELWF